MGIVTDSSGEIPMNVYNIHKLFRAEADLKKIYDENKGKYKILKEALIEDLDAFIKPLRERREMLAKDIDKVEEILEDGAIKAREIADEKLFAVKTTIGVI
jgi:tryptophanyl-tRNA synthetase